jgi:hypothetical protein
LPTLGVRRKPFRVREGARGARSETRPPAFERGACLSWRMGTYLGPVKAGRRVDDRAVNASA